MTISWLKDPVSDDAPCGPDLAETDDAAFVDYYYEAESRMPERHFMPGIKSDNDEFVPGVVFDQKSIKHAKEKETILGLLKRSRDLRLLSLLARMMSLAGRLDDFAEAVEGIADLLETFPDDVHPRDKSDRRGAIDELGNTAVVGLPLHYVQLAGSGDVTYRRYSVAAGQTEPREGELGLNAGAMLTEIGSPGNRKAVEAAHASINTALSALERIKSACMLHGSSPFNPAVSATITALGEMQGLISQGRSDLTPWSAEAAAPAAPEESAADDGDDGGAAPAAAAGGAAQVAAMPATAIANRAAAKQLLSAIGGYLATNEPASPALLLVMQAKLLIGKSLIEAIEALLPENASQTKIDFGPETGFVLHMDRLKMLAAEAASLVKPVESEDPGPAPEIATRAEVSGHIKGVEEFFRVREPASPIPLLLFRARTYLDRDFGSIVSELIPAKPPA